MFLLKSDVFLIGFSMFLVTIKCLLFTSIERNLELKVCISHWKWTFETFIDLVLGKKTMSWEVGPCRQVMQVWFDLGSGTRTSYDISLR